MDRDRIVATLKAEEPSLRALGVRHAALFGSRARGDRHDGSDIDIMLELEPTATVTIFDHVGIRDQIAALFEGAVDVVDKTGRGRRSRRGSGPTRSVHSERSLSAVRYINLALSFT